MRVFIIARKKKDIYHGEDNSVCVSRHREPKWALNPGVLGYKVYMLTIWPKSYPLC